MRDLPKLQWVAGAVGLVAISACWFNRRQAAGFERQSAILRRQIAALEASVTTGKPATAEARAKSSGAVAAAGPSPAKPEDPTDDLQALRTDAAEQAKTLKAERSRDALLFAPLFAKLHLTPEQTAKFLDLMSEHAGAIMDINTAMIERHRLSTDPEAQALKTQEDQRYADALTAMLGPDGYATYKTFADAVYYRNIAAGIAGTALANGVAFTPDQTRRLGDLVQAHTTDQGTDWDAVEAQGRTFLTPAQWEFVDTGESLGPFGLGGKAMIRLNDLITNADRDDIKKGISKPNG